MNSSGSSTRRCGLPATNLLVYAHRTDSQWHEEAAAKVRNLAESRSPWAIPWPCVHEFLAVVTHPNIYAPPTPLEAALAQVDAWLESPTLVMLAETVGYWKNLRDAVMPGRIAGARVHAGSLPCACTTACASCGARTVTFLGSAPCASSIPYWPDPPFHGSGSAANSASGSALSPKVLLTWAKTSLPPRAKTKLPPSWNGFFPVLCWR